MTSAFHYSNIPCITHVYYRMNPRVFVVILTFICVHKNKAQCPSVARYRTFDGYCNNLVHPTWGQAGTIQRRFQDRNGNPMVDYEDGVDLPRGGMPSRLPSPRLVSNTISKESDGPSNQSDSTRSGQTMAFGQLMAHDFIKTKVISGFDCCDANNPNYNDTGVCFNFEIPTNDTRFTPGCKSFIRAPKATSGSNLPAYRENLNLITSFIDAGFLYGSSNAEVEALRENGTYLMKTGTNNNIPLMTGGGCVQFHGQCPLAGENRIAEAPNLGLNHLVWIREHNRIATILDNITDVNATISYIENGKFYQETREDIIFQETRRIIIAMVQHITYNHYLPAVLDQSTMSAYNLYSKTTGYDQTYDSEADVSIRNAFGTAAFRFGHSQIMNNLSFLHDDFVTLNVNSLKDNFKDPQIYLTNNGENIQNFARWLTFHPAELIDPFLVDSARDNLFVHPDPPGDDLFAINIQRGRDQGTPSFNKWREFCGLSNMTFDDFGNSSSKLASVYASPDDIDLFIGALLEKGTDGSVGPTFACMIAKQFQLMKIGDRFWYERPDSNFAFTEAQVNSIKRSASLSKVFCETIGLQKIHGDVFRNPSDISSLVNCTDLPDIDFSLWKMDVSGSTERIGYATGISLAVIFQYILVSL